MPAHICILSECSRLLHTWVSRSEPHLRALHSQGEVTVIKVMLSGDAPLKQVCTYLDQHGHKVTSLPVCVLFHCGKPIDALVGRVTAHPNHTHTHIVTC